MLQRPHTQLSTLLGAILLSSGLASSLALADEGSSAAADSASPATETSTEAKVDDKADDKVETNASSESQEQPEMVEVRISLPDGRTIIRMEPVQARSARSTLSFTNSGHRTLPDGSHISVAARAVSGGTNSSSLRSGGSSGGGGGGSAGGGSSAGGGGGGSGAAASAGRATTPGGSSEGIVQGAQAESMGETAATAAPKSTRAGVYQVTNNTSNYAVQGGSEGSGSTPSRAGTQQTDPTPVVPTVGGPRYNSDGDATGGQRVEFHEAGMSAAVIGNMIYFNGVEFVRADQDFSVVEGTRVGADSVIRQDMRPSNAGVDVLSSFNVGASTIRLGYPSDTVVQLVMQSLAADPGNPDRIQRTWTVRIR